MINAKKYAGLAFIILPILGCSTTINPTYTTTGEAGYRLICGGVFGDGDMGSCYQAAGDICKDQGYRVIQTSVSSLIIECRKNAQSEQGNP